MTFHLSFAVCAKHRHRLRFLKSHSQCFDQAHTMNDMFKEKIARFVFPYIDRTGNDISAMILMLALESVTVANLIASFR